MTALLLAILTSSSVLLLFKFVSKQNIHLFQTVVVNYLVSFFIGIALMKSGSISEMGTKEWLPWAVFLGFVFIVMFYLIGLCTQKTGVAVTAIAHKLSLVIPVAAGMVLYNEQMHLVKGFAIVLAMLSVYFASVRNTNDTSLNGANQLLLPLLVFLGSGFIDTMIKHVEFSILPKEDFHGFLVVLFLTSTVIGALILLFNFLKNTVPFSIKPVAAGIALGFFNYGAVFFIVKALNEINMDKSIIFPVNNIGVVSLSAIAAVVIYKEPLNRFNIIGILLALTAILLLTYESW
ncbi:MAG TPA: hypothetical protein VEA37_13950 [Flavobacterium sp.]|nr:hypothetical protein [Flavobacterium sp.]